MGWNHDMSVAPRGEYRVEVRTVGKNEVERQVHTAPTLFAAGADGELVTMTRWLPKEGRWMMFSKDHPPIAWQALPLHPSIEAQMGFDASAWEDEATASEHQARVAMGSAV